MLSTKKRANGWFIRRSRWIAEKLANNESFVISKDLYRPDIEDDIMEQIYRIDSVVLVAKTDTGIQVRRKV